MDKIKLLQIKKIIVDFMEEHNYLAGKFEIDVSTQRNKVELVFTHSKRHDNKFVTTKTRFEI